MIRMRVSLFMVGCLFFSMLLLAAAVKFAHAQQPTNISLPFSRGEELVYQAEFNKALLRGVDVAEFRFSADTEHIASKDNPAEDPVVLRLIGDVASKGLFTKIVGFHFHQHVESMVDPNPFAVLRTNKLDEQGKRLRISEAVFDHDAHKVTWTDSDPNQTQPPRKTEIDFTEPIQDVLSVIYFLRTLPLELGKSLEVPVSDSGRVFRLSVRIIERKRMNTVLGRVNAVRVEPALFGEGGMVRSRGSLSIWITDDNRRIPVRAQLKVDIGTFDIKLKRVRYREPGRLDRR